MSTRSNIIIKLRDNDINNGIEHNGSTFINYPYLKVYCHHDGYIDGVGAYLAKKNFTYDEALAFILEGDRSSVVEGMSYVARYNESYGDNKPTVFITPAIGDFDILYYYLLVENKDTCHMDVYVHFSPNGEDKWYKLCPDETGEECIIDYNTSIDL